MQFKKAQRGQLQRNWHGGSWFYKSLGPPARAIIATAYGVEEGTPTLRSRAQDDVTTALTLFARRVGCEKSHIVHALLSGSLKALQRAIQKSGSNSAEPHLRAQWESAFRDINVGSLYLGEEGDTNV